MENMYLKNHMKGFQESAEPQLAGLGLLVVIGLECRDLCLLV